MEKHEISLIVEAAKNQIGTFKLAEMLGINPVQISGVIRGREALPFPAALKLADILEADPITVTCANAALKESNPDRKSYLESKILPLEVSRIILFMSPKGIPDQNNRNFPYTSSDKTKINKKVLQGANDCNGKRKDEPRITPKYRRVESETLSLWALRPIPRLIETD